ncbi:MAG: prepilin peptidase [Lentisphaeria bacterium]|nr:prepilin peptidase [Lentisphaeria bacterium]
MDQIGTMTAGDLSPILWQVHAVAFCLGCVIGSFLNVVVWRIPRGESLLTPPSHCPNCGHLIKPWENIPVISWLCLRGRCSGCHQPISIRYPLGESVTGLLFFIIWYKIFQRNLPLGVIPGYFFLAGSLLSAALIDMKHRMIPDEITYAGLLVSLMLALLLPTGRLALQLGGDPSHGSFFITMAYDQLGRLLGVDIRSMPIIAAFADWLFGVFAGVVLLGVFAVAGRHLFKSPQAMGYGDVKLLGMCGGFLGADSVVFIVMLGAVAGLAWGLVRRILLRKEGWSVPYGPFLGVGALAWMCFGNWFFILFGKK